MRTPLLDFFRRGEVARDVRLLAAQGALAPRAHEQLGLLMLLVRDSDPEVAGAAEATLTAIPRESLAAFLARSDVAADMLSFFAARGVQPAAVPLADAEHPLLDTAPEPDPVSDSVDSTAAVPDRASVSGAPEPPPQDDERASTVQKIARLGVAQRMSLAMKGTREERAILIRDPNKIVAVAVLSSPKISETEVEAIARMASVSDEILRMIATTRAWVKNYNVMVSLVRNPKTPVAMSMNLLSRLNDKDMRMLSIDRNVPEILRITARKKVVIEKK